MLINGKSDGDYGMSILAGVRRGDYVPLEQNSATVLGHVKVLAPAT